MKILLTGDWHLDWVTEGVRRHDDIEFVVWAMVDHAINLKVDFFVFLGDLCNPNTVRSHRAVSCAISAAKALEFDGIKTVWITGNHDVIEDGTGDHTLMALAEAGYQVFDRPEPKMIASIDAKHSLLLVPLPYVALARDYDPVEIICVASEHYKDRPKRTTVLVAGHLGMDGITPGSESVDMARGRHVSWPIAEVNEYFPGAIVAGGHYHKGDCSDEVIIPGSPARLNFGEEDNFPKFVIVEGGIKCLDAG